MCLHISSKKKSNYINWVHKMGQSRSSIAIAPVSKIELRNEQSMREMVHRKGCFDIMVDTCWQCTPAAYITQMTCSYNYICLSNDAAYFTSLGPATSLALLRTFADAVVRNDFEHGAPQLVDPMKKWKLPFMSTSEGQCFNHYVKFQLSPHQQAKNIPVGMTWMDVIKLLTIREFHRLAFRVSLDEYLAVASLIGITYKDLIYPLLKTARNAPVDVVTAKYMELVHKYGYRPEVEDGQTLLNLLFSDMRFQHTDNAKPEKYYDKILAHWRSCGIDVRPDDPGYVVIAIFHSRNPRYLRWFLTKYPNINLSLPGRDFDTGELWKKKPYTALNHYMFALTADIVDKMDDVLREFGRESIIDHSALKIHT